MNKKKRYYVILIILVIFFIAMYLLLGKDNLAKDKEETTIIIGNDTIWNYSDRRWMAISNPTTKDNLNWLDYEVYLDSKYIGKYYLWSDDNKWYIFDSNKKAVNKEGSLIAYRANYEIKVKDFETKQIRNNYHAQQVLKNNNLSTSSKYTVSEETSIDLDNDGKNETIYFISNAFALDFNPDTMFSFVFMVKNSKIYPIYTDVAPNYANNGCKPYLSAVIDVDNDNTYELVVSCGRYSVDQPVVMLYKLVGEEFKILISNQ